MFRKNYLQGFLTIALLLIGSAAVFAQTAPVAGRVELKGADGKVTPVEGALIEVFRTDIKAKFPTDTTDKKGAFSFAGLPVGAVFVLSVSGPGINADIIPNIKPGMDKLVISVLPGDGKRWTEEEVRAALANVGSGNTQSAELTAEQKKQQAEYEKKLADTKANNEKIQNQNAVIQKSLEEGNNAYNSKNYDVAIVKYEEGYQASPEFIGSAPVFLNNKGAALKQRAVDVYNANSKNPDANARVAAMAKVQQDLGAAADAYSKSWALLKNAPAAEIKDQNVKMQALNGARDAFRIMALTRQVDTTKTEAAKTLIADYVTLETDQAKKTEAQRILGDIFLAAGDADNAILEYKKVLDINPSDPDSLVGIGLSLISSGYATNDKTKMQEGADYLQKFIDAAPANHKYLQDAKESIAQLKADQNVTPQKGKTTNTKKKN
ncbi:MAG TPA: tetratricopeptide repeat protein [Pyrinomonadaceae bacterium]|jgi:tetratricopeptide (TPR) repeat protein